MEGAQLTGESSIFQGLFVVTAIFIFEPIYFQGSLDVTVNIYILSVHIYLNPLQRTGTFLVYVYYIISHRYIGNHSITTDMVAMIYFPKFVLCVFKLPHHRS
jgi:hypothetical protein